MKRETLFIAALLAAGSVLATSSAHALPASQVAAIKRTIADVPNPEMAARAVSIVAKASSEDRQEVAIETVRAIVSQKPSLAPAVVGAISGAHPELSPVIAAEAAALSQEQAPEIVKAAASAAPAQASKIAGAVSKVVPKSALKIARSATAVAPAIVEEITEAVLASVPSARNEIQNDAVLLRFSRNSAGSPNNPGVITTFSGTINGRPSGDLGAPNQVSNAQVTPGADDERNYGTP